MSLFRDGLVGSLFERKTVVNPKIKDLAQSLYLSLLEIRIILLSLDLFKKGLLPQFDAYVGDRKCQVRASMILDLFYRYKFNYDVQKKILLEYEFRLRKNLEMINSYNLDEIKELAFKLQKTLIFNYYIEHNLHFEPSAELRLISLCYFTTLRTEKVLELIDNLISLRKIKIVLNHGIKIALCELSIQYERDLAQKYAHDEVQKALEQVETKGFCSMTAFFPSFKAIFEKVKQEQQLLLLKVVHICACFGIQGETVTLLSYKDGAFQKRSLDEGLDQVGMIFEGYTYPGSFSKVQKKFDIGEYNTRLPKTHYEACMCKNPSARQPIENIEEAIMAVFVQHPQFTNEADIDFKGLELEGSNLQQEYEYLKLLPGFSIDNMSKLFLTHIYPSMIKDALKTELAPHNLDDF